MEEMYEVLRFVEHGTHCRQSMDCVSGVLLPDYLSRRRKIDKALLFEWFRQLALVLDQYHRCHERQSYRYLNPYSILVAEDEKLLLLDLESPENEFVMRKLQKNSMRKHFVKPVFGMEINGKSDIDLFSYGKTIQFILAYIDVEPSLTKYETFRLEKMIKRCMGQRKKKYDEFKEIMRDLPKGKTYTSGGKKRIIIFAAGTGFIFAVVLTYSVYRKGTAAAVQVEQQEKQAEETAEVQEQSRRESPDGISLESIEKAGESLQALLEEGGEEEYETVILAGRKLELDVERCLSEAYDRLGRKEDAARVYGWLLEIEESYDRIEEAGLRKMELEADMENAEQAVETGKEVLKRIGDSEKIREKIEEYSVDTAEPETADEETAGTKASETEKLP